MFDSGRPTSVVSKVLKARYTAGYNNPEKLVSFIDNHDMERLLRTSSAETVKSAYALIMTIVGIPQIYYGAEQGWPTPCRTVLVCTV